jgi:predicted dehydrogenase
LVGASEPEPERRALVESLRPGLALFATTQEMLESVDSDVLIVATDPSAHADLVCLASRYGQHVVCEKPLALTREQYNRVATEVAPIGSVVAVHQFRHAATWRRIAPWARAARAAGLPFSLAVDIQRVRTDPLAAARWRDAADYGGMLADHGVHYFALGWTLSRRLDVLHAARVLQPGSERSSATVRIGSGRLEFSACAGAATSRNRLVLRVGQAALTWVDDTATASIAGARVTPLRRTGSLSDRRYTDSLYRPFYTELAAKLHDPRWRRRRTEEAATVGATLIAALEAAGLSTPTQNRARLRQG